MITDLEGVENENDEPRVLLNEAEKDIA